MPADDSAEPITDLLREAREPEAQNRLIDAIYPALRRHAGAAIRRSGAGGEIGVTELVNASYADLKRAIEKPGNQFASRQKFFAYAALVMRHTLYRELRRSVANEVIDENFSIDQADDVCRMAVMQGLEKIQADYPRQVEIFDLKHFAGHTVDEIAELKGCSAALVKADLALVRSRLVKLLREE